MSNKAVTHIVLKLDDLMKYLSEEQNKTMNDMIDIIIKGREKDGKKGSNTYYVCNTDEPYADTVHTAIMKGELAKRVFHIVKERKKKVNIK